MDKTRDIFAPLAGVLTGYISTLNIDAVARALTSASTIILAAVAVYNSAAAFVAFIKDRRQRK